MRITLILLGVLYIIIGVVLFIFTDASKEILRNLLKQKNIKLLSIPSLAIGVVLIAGSSLVSVPWVVIALGVLGLLKGLFFIFGPESKTRPLIDWWLGASNSIYKTWSVVAFLIGVLLLLIL